MMFVQIPALTGYCTVSLILQIPIILFLTFNEAIIPLPLERVVYIIHLCFLFAEVSHFNLIDNVLCSLGHNWDCSNPSFG